MKQMKLFVAVCVLFLSKCAASAYRDVYDKGDLRAIIREQSKDAHIILFTYVAGLQRMWQDMSLELCSELNERRYPYVVLTHDAASCDDLLAAAAGRVDPPPVCILDSVLHKTHGYGNSVLTLWVRRYHAAALLAEAGVSVTLLDADTIIKQDFVPVLRRLERDYALIVLGEGPANGGLWHLRASNSSSAALWVIKQVERRTTLLEKFKVHDHDHDAGIHMDQASTLPLKKLCQYLTPPSRTSSGMRYAWRPTRRAARSTSGAISKIRCSRTTSYGRGFHRSSRPTASHGRRRQARRCLRRG